MKIKTICISTALAGAMVAGLTLSNQEAAQAKGDKVKAIRAKVEAKKGKTKVPTPALLPGLIGLGVGVLRKRQDEEVEVDA